QVTTDLFLLPERTRRILLKRRLDNMSYAEIAMSEDMTVAAVEKTVARATLQLMKGGLRS
ncbi:sigma factor-like helix-turn-helix DNA-binding protein, partial [Brevundimonas sp.]